VILGFAKERALYLVEDLNEEEIKEFVVSDFL
jgi:hypothetical protein